MMGNDPALIEQKRATEPPSAMDREKYLLGAAPSILSTGQPKPSAQRSRTCRQWKSNHPGAVAAKPGRLVQPKRVVKAAKVGKVGRVATSRARNQPNTQGPRSSEASLSDMAIDTASMRESESR